MIAAIPNPAAADLAGGAPNPLAPAVNRANRARRALLLGGILNALALGLTLVALARRDPRSPGPALAANLAVIDGKPLSADAFEAELKRTRRGQTPEDLRRVLADTLQREQLLARARRLGLDRDPSVQRAHELALIARLKEVELEPALRAVDPTTPDSTGPAPERTRPANPSAPEEIRLAILRLDASPKSSPGQLRRLEERLDEARSRVANLPPATPGFGPLALEFSDDVATRLGGGDLGWMEATPERYHLDPCVMAAGRDLKSPGELSPILRGRDGLYLVRLIGRRAASDRSVNDLRQQAVARHREYLDRRRAIETAFLDDIRKTIPCTVNTTLLARLEAARPPTPTDDLPLPGLPETDSASPP